VLFLPLCVSAEITNPNIHINEYNRLVASIGVTSRTYDYVMEVYNEYSPILSNTNSSYSDKQIAAFGLKWLFPYLMNGAFYYSEHNNQSKALEFAEAYVDTYINPLMKESDLSVNDLYPTLAYFAASNHYNQRNYDKAITYLDAYIRSGDTKNLSNAFNYTAKAYINTNKTNEAKQVLISGLNLFPSDLQMLTTIINLLAETKTDDSTLQKYVSQALGYKPDEIGLLNIQAQLFERNQEFYKACEFYKKLQLLKPDNLDVARHLGINLYNCGIYKLNSGGTKDDAKPLLEEAATVLADVVISDPLAVNYIYALANTYSLLQDKKNLDLINSKIVALGQTPVSGDVAPQLLAVNNDHVVPSSIPSVQSINNNPTAQNDGVSSNGNTNISHVSISDVDIDIPVTNHHNNNTFAVIIANHDYRKVAKVDNAENDGRIFAEYCNKVLGIPQSHIRTHFNVTYGELLDAVEDIKSIANAKRGNLDVIFYYAGHGVPNEQTKSAYILPVDADGKQMRLCYSLGELYSELNGMNANNTLVFLDACFSGSARSSNDMLLSARSVAIDVNPDEVEGKLVVFSAATGDQTALSYDEQNHGLFTYFLLKRLKETKGNIDLGTLADYLTENVALESQLKNNKQQTPTVIAGNEYGIINWKNLKLIR
jgi:tetratricopeptide (TPR) repeat protein